MGNKRGLTIIRSFEAHLRAPRSCRRPYHCTYPPQRIRKLTDKGDEYAKTVPAPYYAHAASSHLKTTENKEKKYITLKAGADGHIQFEANAYQVFIEGTRFSNVAVLDILSPPLPPDILVFTKQGTHYPWTW